MSAATVAVLLIGLPISNAFAFADPPGRANVWQGVITLDGNLDTQAKRWVGSTTINIDSSTLTVTVVAQFKSPFSTVPFCSSRLTNARIEFIGSNVATSVDTSSATFTYNFESAGEFEFVQVVPEDLEAEVTCLEAF